MSSGTSAYNQDRRLSIWLRRIRLALLTGVLLAFTLVVIVPFIWMIMMSVRTTGEILLNPYGVPTVIRWQNYVRLFLDPQIRFYQYYFNSIFVTFFFRGFLHHSFDHGGVWFWPETVCL